METILVVDDDPGFRKLAASTLTAESYSVDSVASVADARQAAGKKQYHLVLADLGLPNGDGVDLLRWLREYSPRTASIVLTPSGEGMSAVEALKLGAAGHLDKPPSSLDELRLVVRRTLDMRRMEQERTLLRELRRMRSGCDNLIARAPAMVEVLESARGAAQEDSSVLVLGPRGTGKEALAQCIHDNSQRASQAFVAVDCAAVPPALIERELFGREQVSAGGMAALAVGRLERAHGGTLFLDDVGRLDGNLQAKLLRVLEQGTFQRPGGVREVVVDVRMIAGASRDLSRMAQEGTFREDLYHRLSARVLEIPPLKDRPADIAPLARFFLSRAAREMGKGELELAEDALETLLSYPWPGNVRELENAMERAAILCERQVRAQDLPIPQANGDVRLKWWDIERKAIENALRINKGNRTHTARQLGISLRKLQYRLKEYGL